MLHWIGNNCPMWIDWTLNTHLMCSYLLAIFTGKCYVRKFSSSSHLKKKVNFCIHMTRIWNPLPSPYTLVFDLLVRVANVFLELFPLKAEHYDYYNLVIVMIINLEAKLLRAHHDAAVAPPGDQAPVSENIFGIFSQYFWKMILNIFESSHFLNIFARISSLFKCVHAFIGHCF